MHCLPYLNPVSDAEITIEKLDKVAKTVSDKIKNVAKLLVIFVGWCVFNLLISLFVSRSQSVSLDVYRVINEGLRSVATQDMLLVLTIAFDNRLYCVISFAMLLVIGIAFLVCFLISEGSRTVRARVGRRERFAQTAFQCEAYVVSYKQQVAFLA